MCLQPARSAATCRRTRAVARVGGAATSADAPVAAGSDDMQERARRRPAPSHSDWRCVTVAGILARIAPSPAHGSRARGSRRGASLAVRLRVALAVPRPGVGTTVAAHPLVASLDSSSLLPRRIVEVRLDRRRRATEPDGDLGVRQALGLADVPRQRDGTATLGHTVIRRRGSTTAHASRYCEPRRRPRYPRRGLRTYAAPDAAGPGTPAGTTWLQHRAASPSSRAFGSPT
jgi:hypothetical protein